MTGTGLTPATSAPAEHRDWAHSCHICARTGLTCATSAPGLRPPRQLVMIMSDHLTPLPIHRGYSLSPLGYPIEYPAGTLSVRTGCGEFCAAVINPCIFNSGVLVLTPNSQLFSEMKVTATRPPHLHRAATSAPGLGSPCQICTGTRLTPATSAAEQDRWSTCQAEVRK